MQMMMSNVSPDLKNHGKTLRFKLRNVNMMTRDEEREKDD